MSVALAAAQAIVLLTHRGFNSDLPVSGPSIRGLDDEANPASSSSSSRARVFGTNSSCREDPGDIKKTHSPRPGRPCRLAPGHCSHIGRHFTPVGVCWDSSYDAAEPAPFDAIRVSRSGLVRFDFWPSGGLEASLRAALACVQYKKTSH
jgi:hypothetical protein